MYKFFVDENQIKNTQIEIINDDYNHIVNVLRMRVGENILISNKKTAETYNCVIEKITKEKVICNIAKISEINTETNIKVDLFQGLPKSDKMEYIIQKSVELGVQKIIPVNMKYCIAKINDEEKKNIRWNKISEVAAKQSKRSIIPKVNKSIDINELCGEIKNYDLAILAYENEDNTTIKTILKENKNAKTIAVVIGPEGGVSEEEVLKLKNAGAKVASLGSRILRTETAPIAALSMIVYEYEL